MPNWLATILLGMVEGLTEFLPVSSTGHLLLFEQWLPHQTELFNTVIQSGAVVAVLIVFSGRLRALVVHWREAESREYWMKLATAFVITGIGGVTLKKFGWRLPESAGPVAWATLIGGLLILVIERRHETRAGREDITWQVAVAVGLAQLLAATFPGTSRSGATILIAVAMGVARPAAVEFSFLLGIPTLLAASALEIGLELKRGAGGEESSWAMVLLGTLTAGVTAFIIVKWVLRFVQTHTFSAFGWYRIVLGGALIAWEAVRGD